MSGDSLNLSVCIHCSILREAQDVAYPIHAAETSAATIITTVAKLSRALATLDRPDNCRMEEGKNKSSYEELHYAATEQNGILKDDGWDIRISVGLYK
jgi:hypothetical protein